MRRINKQTNKKQCNIEIHMEKSIYFTYIFKRRDNNKHIINQINWKSKLDLTELMNRNRKQQQNSLIFLFIFVILKSNTKTHDLTVKKNERINSFVCVYFNWKFHSSNDQVLEWTMDKYRREKTTGWKSAETNKNILHLKNMRHFSFHRFINICYVLLWFFIGAFNQFYLFSISLNVYHFGWKWKLSMTFLFK